MTSQAALRVLVVDDSAYNRRAIARAFTASGAVEVVGNAADGNEALRLVQNLKPDVITLDLEMPNMDGFSFLRILMSSRPTPVIVVSSYSGKENVFRALELGAVDFVAKPEGGPNGDVGFGELLQKVLMFRSTRAVNVKASPATASSLGIGRRQMPTLTDLSSVSPDYLVGVVSSTGGPSSLTQVFSQLTGRGRYAILVAQHMPERFTRTFAERLDRASMLRVSEAQQADTVRAQAAFVCPGRQCMEVERTTGGDFRLRLFAPRPEDRYVPSGDRLLESIARVAGRRSLGVILTGMGDDGVEGARAIKAAGGVVIAESEETAVIYGMPRVVVSRGLAQEVVPLHKIPALLEGLVTGVR
jgi:two-component system, chemotaxis family, protein-glutamate methylesterase/glutaminase